MAFGIKTSKWLNTTQAGNFVFEPVENICNVQIFDVLDMETCYEMIARLSQIVSQLSPQPQDTISTKITSPYDVSPDKFVFDVAINSAGGDIVTYKAISSMFASAKLRGAIVRTNNIGMAASCASMLAIQGTPGYRIMSYSASNFVHYGLSGVTGSREKELEIATKNSKKEREQVFSIYEKCTNLTQKELERYKTIENSGHLFAPQCLRKGLCDWILTYDGILIGRKR